MKCEPWAGAEKTSPTLPRMENDSRKQRMPYAPLGGAENKYASERVINNVCVGNVGECICSVIITYKPGLSLKMNDDRKIK